MNLLTMDDLAERARHLAECRALLARMVAEMNAQLEALKDQRMEGIRACVDTMRNSWANLEHGIQSSPALFVKPRKVAWHGITFGIEKGKGQVVIDNEDRTVALIKKHMPDHAAVLIQVKETPVKKALQQLTGADLKRIGVGLEDGTDTVVIRPAHSDVDKLINALLRADDSAEKGAVA